MRCTCGDMVLGMEVVHMDPNRGGWVWIGVLCPLWVCSSEIADVFGLEIRVMSCQEDDGGGSGLSEWSPVLGPGLRAMYLYAGLRMIPFLVFVLDVGRGDVGFG